ncbi:hypothetical protein GGX14DRAFT_398917 [Mycena pura]|uniref:Uncharacterized protein n=1 Tax=Mycena pura TaxID=153505 RepID=A0AAD6V9E1_9AGAR|nr:hypothetical protein GGX14DRAFT_398917 [Mycena pura]
MYTSELVQRQCSIDYIWPSLPPKPTSRSSHVLLVLQNTPHISKHSSSCVPPTRLVQWPCKAVAWGVAERWWRRKRARAGRCRAAAARGVENEPVHTQQSVRGRRCSISGWRASRTSPCTLNGAGAGGARRRRGARQRRGASQGGGVENEPTRGVENEPVHTQQSRFSVAGIENKPTLNGVCAGGARRRGWCKAAWVVQGGGVGGVGHRRAALKNGGHRRAAASKTAWGVAGRRHQKRARVGRCRAAAARGVENEPTHAHGSVRAGRYRAVAALRIETEPARSTERARAAARAGCALRTSVGYKKAAEQQSRECSSSSRRPAAAGCVFKVIVDVGAVWDWVGAVSHSNGRLIPSKQAYAQNGGIGRPGVGHGPESG